MLFITTAGDGGRWDWGWGGGKFSNLVSKRQGFNDFLSVFVKKIFSFHVHF